MNFLQIQGGNKTICLGLCVCVPKGMNPRNVVSASLVQGGRCAAPLCLVELVLGQRDNFGTKLSFSLATLSCLEGSMCATAKKKSLIHHIQLR